MQSSSNFRLIVRRGPQPNQIYDLNKGIITIGRDITNDIVINDPEVSRHHCRLTQGGGGYTIEDLGSTNGTFVNGQRLTGARPLSHGDMLGLGETVTLAFESAAEAPVAGAEAGPGAAATMPGQAPSPYAPPPVGGYPQPPVAQEPYPGAGMQSPSAPYGAQQPMAYDYDYQDDPYESAGPGRWIILGCGCFLVLCIVTSVIGSIIIDATCSWDDIPVISEMFDLHVSEDATCR